MNANKPGTKALRASKWTATAAVMAAALALAACSSSGKASSDTTAAGSSSAPSSDCVTKAQTFLKPYDTLPTKLPSYYAPLSKKPTPGKLVIQLAGPIPSDQSGFVQLQKAAAVINWQAKKINFAGTVEDLNSKFEEAIGDKPAVIQLAGYPVAAIQKPIADAKAAGIIVALNSIADQPSGTTGFAAVSNGVETYKKLGEIQAYQFISESKCKGSVAIFNLPFPILKVGTDTFKATVKANCPDCKVAESILQQSDIGTPAATNAIVSKLQSSADIKYVFTVIANLAVGLPTAFSQAGIKGINIFGAVPDETAIAALRDKSNAWWVEESSDQNAWLTLDAALRVLDTGKPSVDTGEYPLTVLTQSNITSSNAAVPSYPLDYADELKKIWLGA